MFNLPTPVLAASAVVVLVLVAVAARTLTPRILTSVRVRRTTTTVPTSPSRGVEPLEISDARMLRRLLWAVRAVLAVAAAASVAANVLHAEPTTVARIISAWPPLALLATIELISRVPVHRAELAWTRRAVTGVIAGIAAWVSYWHMVAVTSSAGETASAAHLVPLSVDGLVVVASICLVELGGRLRAALSTPADGQDDVAQLEQEHRATIQRLDAQIADLTDDVAKRETTLRGRWDALHAIYMDAGADIESRRRAAVTLGIEPPADDPAVIVADAPASKAAAARAALTLTGGDVPAADRLLQGLGLTVHRSYVSRIAKTAPAAEADAQAAA